MNLEKKIEQLVKQVGRPYVEYNSNGGAQGCGYPILFVYDWLPDFFIKITGNENLVNDVNRVFLDKYCFQIKKEELKMGDILVLPIRNQFHIALFYKQQKIISVFSEGKLMLHRFNELWGCECYRMK